MCVCVSRMMRMGGKNEEEERVSLQMQQVLP